MVCQIKKIELTTDAENGNYLTVTGYDVKGWLDQRIVTDTISVRNIQAERFIRNYLVARSISILASADRKIVDSNGNVIVDVQDSNSFLDIITTQVSYKNVGEKVREICRSRLCRD